MTARELIRILEDLDPDTEIRIMSQPDWPFEYTVAGLALALDLDGFQPADAGDLDLDEVAYLVEGQQLGYGCKTAWQAYRRY